MTKEEFLEVVMNGDHRELSMELTDVSIEHVVNPAFNIDGHDCYFTFRKESGNDAIMRLSREIAMILGVDPDRAVYPEDDIDLGYAQSVYFYKPREVGMKQDWYFAPWVFGIGSNSGRFLDECDCARFNDWFYKRFIEFN